MFLFSPLSGYIFDNYGPRVPILLGSVMHVFGLMMLSLSTEYYQIMLSQSICSGIGLSLFFTPSLTAVSSTERFLHLPLTFATAANLVRKETCFGTWDMCVRLGHWRGGLSPHGSTVDSSDRFCLDDSQLCLLDLGPTCSGQPYNQLQSDPRTEAIQVVQIFSAAW